MSYIDLKKMEIFFSNNHSSLLYCNKNILVLGFSLDALRGCTDILLNTFKLDNHAADREKEVQNLLEIR